MNDKLSMPVQFLKRILLTLGLTISIVIAAESPVFAGTVTNAWSDNPTLCAPSSACTKSGNLVRAWQTIVINNVYDDCGNLGCYATYGCWFVDGSFGSNSTAGTKAYQGNIGVTSDGWVGSGTWSEVYSRLVRHSANDTPSTIGYALPSLYPVYGGSSTYFYRVQSSGAWYFKDRCDGNRWKAMSF
ncbi:peptidoglycan-binding domain-containing protein [Glycomyces tritici]|uniref:Peptidoglycan binding-like domain-containing protein n=1 Tax=Glycomyces tritici TaxID=2665176 RepID=A0ABT7YPZ2_9ACTN|nr:hypothetical protein [Glycomyces tritici]MDN3240686.1 hypothetical protein [Glycomyces tritici]